MRGAGGLEALRFIADENVPRAIVEVLRSRGHDVIESRSVIGQRAPDELVDAFADQQRANLITFNPRDFKRIADRRPPPLSDRRSYRNYSALYFKCEYAQAVQRLRVHLDLLEWEASRANEASDKRIFVTIGNRQVNIHR
jgi:hypothetical protein